MAADGRQTSPLSFRLFIFFVLCHVVCGESTELVKDPSQVQSSFSNGFRRLHKRHQPPQRLEATAAVSGDSTSNSSAGFSFSTAFSRRQYPVFIDEPASHVVGPAKPVSLNCSYLSPTPVRVVWLLNGSRLEQSRLERLGIRVARYGSAGGEEPEDEEDVDDVGGPGIGVVEGGDVIDDVMAGHGDGLLSAGRMGYYGSYGSRDSSNTTVEDVYLDDDDDDDDDDGVGGGGGGVDGHDDDDEEVPRRDEDGVLDVTNFRARDFPKQRIRHGSQRRTDKRHLDPSSHWSESREFAAGRKRDAGSDEDAILYQRPKSSIHKSLEMLHISGFIPHLHQGTFQCLLETAEVGSMLSREAKVEAASMTPFESIQTKIVPVVAHLGATVVLPCVPPFSRPEASVEFRSNGSKVELTDRHLLLPSGNLQIWNLTHLDASNYSCHAHNPVSNQKSMSPIVHSLQVVEPSSPQPTKYSRPHQEFVTAILGQNLTLECWAQGWPQPRITWEKYGGHLPKERSRTLMGNLLIERVESNDVGTYLCKAGNDVGTPPGDKVFSVEVLEPPTVFVSPPSVEVNRGRSVSITCKAEGAPRPTIQWLHNGQPMTRDPYQDSTLVLSNVRSSQAGTYQCFARNSLGVEQGFSRVVITRGDDVDFEETEEEKTSDATRDGARMDVEMPAPSKPEVVKTNGSSAKVKWSYRFVHDLPVLPLDAVATPPVPTAYPLYFKIQYKDVSDDTGGPWKTIPEEIDLGKRQYEVKKLRSAGAYRFRVVVFYSDNESRSGPTSVKVSMSAKPALPVPIIVDIRPLNSTQMLIGWQMQADSSWLADGFLVTYAPNDLDFDDASKRQVNRPEVREVVLTDLVPSTQYKVRVHSFSSGAGKSAPSNTVVAKTPASEGPPPRFNPKFGPTLTSRFNSDSFDQYDPSFQGPFDGTNPSYREAGLPRNHQKGDHKSDSGEKRSSGSGDKFSGQPNLVYVLLGSILCLIVTVVVAFLVSCVIRRRRHEFGEKEKQKLKEKGIERLKQSSSMNTTAPLLLGDSGRTAGGIGHAPSNFQPILASQSFPSQTGIFQQNYQIKSKPAYTGSALVGEGGEGGQPWGQGQARARQGQGREEGEEEEEEDEKKEQFYFQQNDDQNHIYSTLEEPPLKSSPHPSTTYPRFYPGGASPDLGKEYPMSDHQLYHRSNQNGSHGKSAATATGTDVTFVPQQRVQVQGRPTAGVAQGQMSSSRVNDWYQESENPSSLTKEQATNTVNTFYDNDPAADGVTADWSENAYSSLEGFSKEKQHQHQQQQQYQHQQHQHQRQLQRFHASEEGAISSADSGSLDDDFRLANGGCSGDGSSGFYRDEVEVRQGRQKTPFHKGDPAQQDHHHHQRHLQQQQHRHHHHLNQHARNGSGGPTNQPNFGFQLPRFPYHHGQQHQQQQLHHHQQQHQPQHHHHQHYLQSPVADGRTK